MGELHDVGRLISFGAGECAQPTEPESVKLSLMRAVLFGLEGLALAPQALKPNMVRSKMAERGCINVRDLAHPPAFIALLCRYLQVDPSLLRDKGGTFNITLGRRPVGEGLGVSLEYGVTMPRVPSIFANSVDHLCRLALNATTQTARLQTASSQPPQGVDIATLPSALDAAMLDIHAVYKDAGIAMPFSMLPLEVQQA